MFVGQFAAHVVEAYAGFHVVVEDVGGQSDVAVAQAHFFAGVGVENGHLVEAAVVEIVGKDEEGVALLHAHVAEGFDRVGDFIEVGAVAIHEHSTFAQLDVALNELILVEGRLVGIFDVAQAVGVFKEHFVGLRVVGRGDGGPDAALGGFFLAGGGVGFLRGGHGQERRNPQ